MRICVFSSKFESEQWFNVFFQRRRLKFCKGRQFLCAELLMIKFFCDFQGNAGVISKIDLDNVLEITNRNQKEKVSS